MAVLVSILADWRNTVSTVKNIIKPPLVEGGVIRILTLVLSINLRPLQFVGGVNLY